MRYSSAGADRNDDLIKQLGRQFATSAPSGNSYKICSPAGQQFGEKTKAHNRFFLSNFKAIHAKGSNTTKIDNHPSQHRKRATTRPPYFFNCHLHFFRKKFKHIHRGSQWTKTEHVGNKKPANRSWLRASSHLRISADYFLVRSRSRTNRRSQIQFGMAMLSSTGIRMSLVLVSDYGEADEPGTTTAR